MKIGILLMKNILTQLAKCLLIALVIPQQMQDLIKRMSKIHVLLKGVSETMEKETKNRWMFWHAGSFFSCYSIKKYVK